MSAPNQKQGLSAAVGAFVIWGILPIYWKALDRFAALEIVTHRILWSLAFLLVVLTMRRRLACLGRALCEPRQLGTHLLTGGLLLFNWLIYIWATLNGRILECSLGYFMTPLVNVALGCMVLRERLSPRLRRAIALAATGVVLQMLRLTAFPWVALCLAVSFGCYGLIRKQSVLGPAAGLTLETVLLAPVALLYLAYIMADGGSGLTEATHGELIGLICTGAVTSVPLLLFASAARALPLHTVGLLQYLAPTLQFLIGWLLYSEALDTLRLASFVLIWIALAQYAAELRSRSA